VPGEDKILSLTAFESGTILSGENGETKTNVVSQGKKGIGEARLR
jgi:hypothetical protein